MGNLFNLTVPYIESLLYQFHLRSFCKNVCSKKVNQQGFKFAILVYYFNQNILENANSKLFTVESFYNDPFNKERCVVGNISTSRKWEGFLKRIFPVEVAILYNKSLLYFVKFYFKKEFHLLKIFVLFGLPGHSIEMDYKNFKN